MIETTKFGYGTETYNFIDEADLKAEMIEADLERDNVYKSPELQSAELAESYREAFQEKMSKEDFLKEYGPYIEKVTKEELDKKIKEKEEEISKAKAEAYRLQKFLEEEKKRQEIRKEKREQKALEFKIEYKLNGRNY